MYRRALLKGILAMPFGTSRTRGFANAILSFFQAGSVSLTSKGLLVYSVTPGAANKLIGSITFSAFVDKYGNQVLAGITSYTPTSAINITLASITYFSAANQTAGWGISPSSVAFGGNNLTLQSSNTVEMASGNPLLLNVNNNVGELNVDTNENLQWTSGANGDGNTYAIGKQTLIDASGQVINNTSPTPVHAISLNVLAGVTYHLKIHLFWNTTAVAGNPTLSFSGTAVVSHVDGYDEWHGPGYAYVTGTYMFGSFPSLGGPTFNNGNNDWELECWVTFSTSGTFILNAQTSNAADTWTIKSCYAEMEPVD